MADPTHPRSQSPARNGPVNRLSKASLSRAGLAAALLLFFLSWPATDFAPETGALVGLQAPAPRDSGQTKTELRGDLEDVCRAVGFPLGDSGVDKTAIENCKLALEIHALNTDLERRAGWWREFISPVLVLIFGLVSGYVAHFLTHRRERELNKERELHLNQLAEAKNRYDVLLAERKKLDDLDQAVHQQRLKMYPKLTKAAEPLAVYFPPKDTSESDTVVEVNPITPDVCHKMGRDMSEWYFSEGGLILSDWARDAYFNLMRALTRASIKPSIKLNVPNGRDDDLKISTEKLKTYRECLGIREYDQALREQREERKEVAPEKLEEIRKHDEALETSRKNRNTDDIDTIDGWTFGPKLDKKDEKRWIEEKLAEWINQKKHESSEKVNIENNVTLKLEQLTSAFQYKDYVFLQQWASLFRTELTEDIQSRRRPAG